MPDPARAFFEARLGHDFGSIRVHQGESSARANRELGARAFTYGHHIWLGRGTEPKPGRVLAHEVAHVVQNARGGSNPEVLRRDRDETTTTMDAAPESSCSLAQLNTIRELVPSVVGLLDFMTVALGRYLESQGASRRQHAHNPLAARVATALERRFGRANPQVATHVRDRFRQMRELIGAESSFEIQCRPPGMSCEGRSALYSRSTRTLSLCQNFFAPRPERRGDVSERVLDIVHELAHALTTGFAIDDLAYRDERLFRQLAPHLALVNADSYTLFAQEVVTGLDPSPLPSFNNDEGCDRWHADVEAAVAVAEVWNSRAFQATSQRHAPFLRAPDWQALRNHYLGGLDLARLDRALAAYGTARDVLAMGAFGIVCHPGDDGPCTGSAPAFADRNPVLRGGPLVHLCSTWTRLTADQQAVHFLAALHMGGSQEPRAPTVEALNHAELARRIFTDIVAAEAPRSLEELLD